MLFRQRIIILQTYSKITFMVYRAIGLMSGSSLDGLDICFTEFSENAGKWEYKILCADTYGYSEEWISRLKNAGSLPALDYQLLHTEYGHYLGQQVNRFIEERKLKYQVALIASHGHTTFHLPSKKMTAQLGDGAALAAETGLPVVSDLRALDVALGGQGAPIVPIGEKYLWNEYDYFLNIGGIANISASGEPPSGGWAFDVCPANRVLNMLANEMGKDFDEDGKIAESGDINRELLEKLNAQEYYSLPYPKSLANEFGTGVIYPMIRDTGCGIRDALRSYVEHIALQIKNAVVLLKKKQQATQKQLLLATGGGALNKFLIKRLNEELSVFNLEVLVPDASLVNYKEALIMAFIGVLRWRQEYNVLASVTGAKRNSIGGALWNGQEA
jgi:anhydro-N-acetylmuramic acid kinase